MSEKYTPFKMNGHELPGPNQRSSPTKKLGKNILKPKDPVYKKSRKVSRASDYDKEGGKGR